MKVGKRELQTERLSCIRFGNYKQSLFEAEGFCGILGAWDLGRGCIVKGFVKGFETISLYSCPCYHQGKLWFGLPTYHYWERLLGWHLSRRDRREKSAMEGKKEILMLESMKSAWILISALSLTSSVTLGRLFRLSMSWYSCL